MEKGEEGILVVWWPGKGGPGDGVVSRVGGGGVYV